MLTKEERFQIAWEVFDRLAPHTPTRDHSREPDVYLLDTMSLPDESFGETEQATIFPLPSLREMVNKFGPLPPFSAVVGICEDGLPFLFDLSDPTTGSVLINGDDSTGKVRLLKTILGSVSVLNHQDCVQFALITPNSGNYTDLTIRPHCAETISTYDRASSEIIIDLVKIAE